MGRKITQENSSLAEHVALRASLVLANEEDVYREEENAGLTAQMWQAVSMLVAGRRQIDVAEALGVTQETVSRWRRVPMFAAAVNAGVREAYNGVLGEVRDASADAVHVLREIMQRSEDERLRLTAALAVLRLRLSLDAETNNLPVTPADVARERLRKTRHAAIEDVLL